MAEYSRVFPGMQGGREGMGKAEVTLSAKATEIQNLLGCCHKNRGAVLSFGLSMPLLSPTGGPASIFNSSHDTTVEVSDSWWLQCPDFCQSGTSQRCMACLCNKNKTKPRAAAYCLCLHFLS